MLSFDIHAQRTVLQFLHLTLLPSCFVSANRRDSFSIMGGVIPHLSNLS